MIVIKYLMNCYFSDQLMKIIMMDCFYWVFRLIYYCFTLTYYERYSIENYKKLYIISILYKKCYLKTIYYNS